MSNPEIPVLSRRDVEPYTPPGSPRTYQIAPLTVRERLRARAAVVSEGGVYPDQAAMFEGMRSALREAEPENLAELISVLDAAEGAPDDQDLVAQVVRIETACQSAPQYTALMGRREQHLSVIPFVYFLHAVRGWAGPDLPAFERRGGLVREELLEAVPDIELRLVGWRAQALSQPSTAARGNSAAPSPSSGTKKGTPARRSPSAAGATSSRAKRSSKIPA
jgi:hypothetical protein